MPVPHCSYAWTSTSVSQRARRLVRRPPQLCGHGSGIQAEVVRVQHQIERGGRQGEVELLLRLRQRVRVGRRGAGPNLRGDAEELGELIDLRLVQMGNGFYVGETVTAFYEESLIVFQPVGCDDHRVVEPIGLVILSARANALVE